jgi:hypothetical protein
MLLYAVAVRAGYEEARLQDDLILTDSAAGPFRANSGGGNYPG